MGLDYNYFRYYDPSTGRYITSDPIGILRDYSDPQFQHAIELGVLGNTRNRNASKTLNHLYAYVGGNPINRVDIFGLEEQLICMAIPCTIQCKDLEGHGDKYCRCRYECAYALCTPMRPACILKARRKLHFCVGGTGIPEDWGTSDSPLPSG